MPISIIANRSSQYAQSAMQKQNAQILTSTQKITSGLRVFDASEDAAALTVGTNLKVENASLNTAAINATAGVSMLQVADGAMGQISDLLSRMQTLANQSGSGHLDDDARALVDNEYQTLMEEITRVVGVTSFNGVSMLAGSRAFTTTGGSSLAAAGVSAVRYDGTLVSGDETLRMRYDATTERVTLSRIDGATTQSQSIDLTQLLDTVAGVTQNLSTSQSLDITFAQLGVTLTLGSAFDRASSIDPTSVSDGTDSHITFSAPVVTVPSTSVAMASVAALTGLAGGYSTTTGVLTLPVTSNGTTVVLGALAGVRYAVNGGAVGASGAASTDLVGVGTTVDVYVDLASGGTQKVGTVSLGTVSTDAASTGTLAVAVGAGLIAADMTDTTDFTGSTTLTYKVGTSVVAGQDLVNVTIPALNLTALGLAGAAVDTKAHANLAIDALNNAMDILNQSRAEVGAQQVRLEAVANNLGIVQINNEAARSALLDVDVSAEISTLTNNQVLMQASIAMLKQANQLPSQLLELLK